MLNKNKKKPKTLSPLKSAARVKELRAMLAMGVRELARSIKSSPSSITCWEKGRRSPNIDQCYRLINLAKTHNIGIDLEWLRPK